MRAGNRLYCKKRLEAEMVWGKTPESWFYVGKWYLINKTGYNYVFVLDNDGSLVVFSMDEKDSRSVQEFFYTEQDIRKMKLEKIEEYGSRR